MHLQLQEEQIERMRGDELDSKYKFIRIGRTDRKEKMHTRDLNVQVSGTIEIKEWEISSPDGRSDIGRHLDLT